MIRGFSTRAVLSALAAAVVIGCNGTTVVPSERPGESSTPVALATPSPTPRSFEPLPSACPAPPPDSTASITVSYQARKGFASGDLGLVSVTPSAGGAPTEFGPPVSGWDGGLLRGGDHVELTVKGESASTASLEITTLASSLRMADGRILPVAVERDPLRLAIPDVNGSANLDVSLTWSDACFEYEAATSFNVEVVLSAIVDACPVDEAFDVMLQEHAGAELDVAGARVPFHIDGWGERYGGRGGDADGAWLFEFGESTPVVAAVQGSSLRYAVIDPELRLLDGRVEFYSREAVLNQTVGEAAFWAHRRTANAASSFDLAVPDQPGRYAAFATFQWQLPCALGGAHALIGVDVE